MNTTSKPGFFAWQYKKFHKKGESAYTPIWSRDKPSDRAADGTKRRIAGVVELNESHVGMSLPELALLFPAPDTNKVEVIPPTNG